MVIYLESLLHAQKGLYQACGYKQMVCQQFFWNLLYTVNQLILFTIFTFLVGQEIKTWSSLEMHIMLPFSNGYSSFFGFIQWIQGVASATFWEQTGRCCVIKPFKKNFHPLKKKLDSLKRNWYLSLPLLVSLWTQWVK